MAVFEAGVVALTPEPAGVDLLSRTGIELADLYAAVVPEDSYLYQAGLRPGHKIVRLDSEPMPPGPPSASASCSRRIGRTA